MKLIWQIIWKTPAVILALVIGYIGASQAGWSGAEAMLGPSTGPLDDLGTALIGAFGAAIALGALFLVLKIAKHALWIMVPIFVYGAVVPGVWDGFAGDFDSTRVQAIQHHKANAYALEHMSDIARLHSCKDNRIVLTADAQALCAQVLNGGS